MQDDIAPRRRRWPYILIVLVIVLAGLWSAAWYAGARFVEAAIVRLQERQAVTGRIQTCGSQTVSGFPFRIELRCTDPSVELKSAQPALAFKAKDALVVASVWQPTRLTGEITGPLTIAAPGSDATIVANWRHARAQLRGLPLSPDELSIVLDEPTVDHTSGSETQRLFNAARLETVARLVDGSPIVNPVIDIVLKLGAAVGPLHPLTALPMDAYIAAVAVLRGFHGYTPKPWFERFREVQAAGGRLEITKARVQQGETIALANGALSLTPTGRPDGELKLTVANLANLLPALGLEGRTPQVPNKQMDAAVNRLDRISPGLGNVARQNAAPALIAGLNFIGQPAEIDGRRAHTLPLRFKDGVMTLGPIPLGQVPPLF